MAVRLFIIYCNVQRKPHTHMNKPQGSCFVSNQHFNAAGILREKYWMVIHERKKNIIQLMMIDARSIEQT